MNKRRAFRAGRNLEAVYENIELITGQRGDGQDRAITARDLVALGLARLGRAPGGQFQPLPGVDPGIISRDGVTGGFGQVDFPPPPEALQAHGGFSAVLLEWKIPRYRGHALTEIYRHSEDNLADAVLVATSVSTLYGDPVDPGWQGFYWVRFVNIAGVAGPFNASAGTPAQTSPEIGAVVSLIEREINDSPLISELAAELENGQQALIETGERLTTVDRDGSQAFQVLWSQKSRVGEISAGIGIVAGSDAQGNPLSQVAIAANQFFVFDPNNPNDDGTYAIPFVVDGTSGRVIMAKAAIEQATIQILQAQRIVADEVKAGISLSAPQITGAQIFASAITSLGNPPRFALTPDGGLFARQADISGHINATSGRLSRVTIDETCDVKEIRAETIKGDIVKVITLRLGAPLQISAAPFDRLLFAMPVAAHGTTSTSTTSSGREGRDRTSTSYSGTRIGININGREVVVADQFGSGVDVGTAIESIPAATNITLELWVEKMNGNSTRRYTDDQTISMTLNCLLYKA
ncbi:hypothetical protein EDWATA_02151 [Edwardsiella tarda ATCC 23685]|uniref:Tip attachment protein J central straight fiber domain-containing protein n=1 Tax=Edwardsiella tarda ATCC 23685 TaxID=500638 RepID=D4F5X1_EDWTA|nr:DUF1983 domain-containing protein [Edwardsiella tarda]EFE22842.1 hypothetical protein EDWATA_02151 [Edwardsiella tarda ATCC 23685]GAC63869.1 hypothetical protein ET1_07_00990 [Edwardsiella tarda ATCC 15947 = NBRC 105688]STD44976.1 Fibronectin type III protein [Edwardsiella tarda]